MKTKRSTLLFTGLIILSAMLAVPARSLAGDPGFTDSFMLDKCVFESRGRNPYFVLEPGFQLLFEGIEGKAFVRLQITVLNETKTIAGVRTRVIEELETHDSQLVEISRNYFAICQQNGSVFYFGEDVDIYENGAVVSHASSWRAGVAGARAGLFMPGLSLLGARYYQEVAPGVAQDRAEILSLTEVVVTPAQTFENCLKTVETTPLEPAAKELKLYAPGIGLIQDGTLKLVWFSPGF